MRMPSCKQHDRQFFFVETTQMSSSSTRWCFRNSEWLRQDLIPRISPQRDWCNVFPRYFCNSNSNHFLAGFSSVGKFPCGIWHNSNLVVLLFLWFIYFWGRKNQSALKLVLDFESPSKFWGFRITYRLPVGLPLLRKRPIKNIVQIDYPRVSPGAHPLAKKPEDSGYEIGATFDRNLIHSAEARFLVMACVGYSRAQLKTISSLLKRFLWVVALLQFGAINSDGTLVTVQFGNFIIKIW